MSMKKLFITSMFLIIYSNQSYSQIKELILNDPDKKSPTNVRNKPGGDIIGTIDSREESPIVKIISKEGNYFLVKSFQLCGRNEIKLSKSGYIHFSVLGCFISNYEQKKIKIYSTEAKTLVLKNVTYSNEFVNVLDYRNGMYQVYRKQSNEKFWIDPEYLCFDVCTNCN